MAASPRKEGIRRELSTGLSSFNIVGEHNATMLETDAECEFDFTGLRADGQRKFRAALNLVRANSISPWRIAFFCH